MSSVTGRVKEIKQPRGGYISPSQFETKQLDDGKILFKEENIHASIVGMAVEYLTRLVMGESAPEAFSISLQGAMIASMTGKPDVKETVFRFISNIKGIDSVSVINACKLATYDVWYRNLPAAFMAKTAEETNPDSFTIQNIQIMVCRSVEFWRKYGPIVETGFNFEKDGYTKTVQSGDGDFLTCDTIWDFKVSKTKPTNQHTLQLLMYWIMGKHSGKKEFQNITNLGIFNPRLNTVYMLPISKVGIETIKVVETEVICY